MKRNLITGLFMLSLMSLLAISGTGLYYSPENWHENVKWAHIWVGLISILWLPYIFLLESIKEKIHEFYFDCSVSTNI